MTRRWVSLLLVPLLLAGCLGPVGEPDAFEVIELHVLLGYEPRRSTFDELIKIFIDQHPYVRVRIRQLDHERLTHSDGRANKSALEGIDLIFVESQIVPQLAKDGALLDLSHLRVPTFDPVVAPLADALGTVDGIRVGVPLHLTPEMIAINAEVLARAGVTPPPVDWTIDDWERMHVQVQTAEPLAHVPWAGMLLEPMAFAYGGYLYDAPTGDWGFSLPQTEQAMAWIGRQINNGSLKFGIASGPGESFVVDPLVRTFTGTTALYGDPIIRPYPRGPGGVATRATALMGVVPASSAHPQEAAAFLLEMVNNSAAQQALARGGMRPVTADTTALAVWREAVGTDIAEATEISLAGAFVSDGVPAPLTSIMSGLLFYFEGKVTYAEALPGLMRALPRLND